MFAGNPEVKKVKQRPHKATLKKVFSAAGNIFDLGAASSADLFSANGVSSCCS